MSCVNLQVHSGTRTGWTYLKHALLEPYTALMLVAAVIYGILSISLVVPLMVILVELLLITGVSRLEVFREYVDARLDRAAQAAAAEARAALLLQMDEEHRSELLELEQLLDVIRGRVKPHGERVEAALNDYLGLSRLTASYVRLAIAHRTRREALAKTSRHMLQNEVESLGALRQCAPPRLRELVERRLAIAARRVERWDRTREELEALTHQLATIGEFVHLLYEQPLGPVESPDMGGEIDRFLDQVEDNEGTLHELAALAEQASEEEIDVLELGRHRLAVNA